MLPVPLQSITNQVWPHLLGLGQRAIALLFLGRVSVSVSGALPLTRSRSGTTWASCAHDTVRSTGTHTSDWPVSLATWQPRFQKQTKKREEEKKKKIERKEQTHMVARLRAVDTRTNTVLHHHLEIKLSQLNARDGVVSSCSPRSAGLRPWMAKMSETIAAEHRDACSWLSASQAALEKTTHVGVRVKEHFIEREFT